MMIVFRAGADDEYTMDWNRKSWQLIRFRPQILRPIVKIDLSTSMVGHKFSLPFFISPAGGGKLAHPDGEVLMTKAVAKHDALQWVCNMAGCTKEEIARARAPDQTLFWQVYAKGDLSITEGEINEAVRLGYKGFAFTVDAVRAGKRERDMRLSIEQNEVCTLRLFPRMLLILLL
jgi:L-lactate dehydrogenase (cytochrome)